jgi:single-strand DNA-binding protein
MNKWIGLGRLVKDPEVKYTESGKVVTQFTLAVNRPFTNQQGQNEADFIPVVVWGKQAELIGNSCAKGHRLLVEGRIQIRSYDGKDGTKRWVTEIIANNFEFIERKEQPKDMANMGTDVTKDAPFNEEIPF